ncbi:hypothetical protein BZA05DRAFT_389808 [Tricharina praecox]|uniref:uncharacterized protein n=1 Tax=Tricharina praecox TaxID=43433 RepID=UPI0022208AEB|nr:uncharacterized protein BZA05DRAFT_389808 [Tricharina praecox]KAI5855830.1 hypothetical protein BZA05DRAFT_389808 [Tricharina praecox]
MSDIKPTDTAVTEQQVPNKGKGKAVAEPVETEDESSDEEMGASDEVMDLEDVEEDDLAEIDTSNIIQGGRTRGAKIDFKAVQENEMIDDDEDEDDDDFQAPKENHGDDDVMMDTK